MRLAETRIVFMGSPSFALPSLNALHAAGASIVGIVTQPDKPVGREHTARATAVAHRAHELDFPVFKPKGLKKEENRTFLWDLHPDLVVVVAYGRILPKEALDLPRFGAINVHASLLPKYRGPAPIPAAILAGDAETGVTIMQLDEGMDTGPLLAQERLATGPDDTTASLSAKLAERGAALLVPTLERYLAGSLSPTPQDPTAASTCAMIQKDDGRIDWTKSAVVIERMVRAYDLWPRAFTAWADRRLIIRRVVVREDENPSRPPGRVTVRDGRVCIATGEGLLELAEVQLEGRKPLPANTFVRGHPAFAGSVLDAKVAVRTQSA